ncbi:MAG: hypothetical protein IJC73_02390 [Lentisphaeria bacterium]|nr:hypothetical protein [Lentisphaeria bacterium]
MKKRWIWGIAGGMVAAIAALMVWRLPDWLPEPGPVTLPGGGRLVREDGRYGIRDLVLDRLPTPAEWQQLTGACRGREIPAAGIIRLPDGVEIPFESGRITPERNGICRVVLTAEKGKMTACWDPSAKNIDLEFLFESVGNQNIAFLTGLPLQLNNSRFYGEMTVDMTDNDPMCRRASVTFAGDAGMVVAGGRRIAVTQAVYQDHRWQVQGLAQWGDAEIRTLRLAGSGNDWQWQGQLCLTGAAPLPVQGRLADGVWEMLPSEAADWQILFSHGGGAWLGNVSVGEQKDALVLTGQLRALTGPGGLAAASGLLQMVRQDGDWRWELRTGRLQLELAGRQFDFTDAVLIRHGGHFEIRAGTAVYRGEDSSVRLTDMTVSGRWKDNEILPEKWSGALRYRSGALVLTAADWRVENGRGSFRQGQLENGAATWTAGAGEWQSGAAGITVDCGSVQFTGKPLKDVRLTAAQLVFDGAGNGVPHTVRAESVTGKYDGAGVFSLRGFHWSKTQMTVAEGKVTVDGNDWQLTGSIPGKVTGKTVPGGMTDAFEAETEWSDDGLVTYKGRGTGAFFAGGGFFFRGTAQRHDLLTTLQAVVELPSARIDRKAAAAVFGLPAPWEFTGRCSASGDFAMARQPHLRVDWKLDGTLTAGDAACTGVDAVLRPDGGTVKFTALTSPGLTAANGVMRLEKAGDDAKQSHFQMQSFECAGGRWKYESSTGDVSRFIVDGVSAEQLHPALAGVIAVPLSGTVDLDTRQGIALCAARLTAGEGGHLKLGALESFRFLPEKGVNPEVFECAAALGKDFVFKRLDLRLRRSGKGMWVNLAAAGHPADAIPFVPTEHGFRRTREGETGFFGNCELGSDYLLPDDAAGKTPSSR